MPRNRSSRTRAGGRSMRNRGLLTEFLGRPTRESRTLRVLGWLIRARAELVLFSLWVCTHLMMIAVSGWSGRVCLLVEAGAVTIIFAVPVSRRYVSRRIWAVTDRHRIYTCFLQDRVMTPDGKTPYLVWARPCPVGETVQAWLPGGLSVSDVDNTTEAMAAACYAAGARVEVNKRYTHLVTITIVRRDPFTGRKIVRPDHLSGVPVTGTDDAWSPLPDRESVPMPTPPAQHPTVVASMAFAGARRGNRATRRPGGTTNTTHPKNRTDTDASDQEVHEQPSTPPPVVGIGGMDVSDYV